MIALKHCHKYLVSTSFLAILLLSGCGDGIETYPVSGKVMLKDQPLKPKSGYVTLKPMADKDNTTKFEPSGAIQPDGTYVIYTTKNHSGAPPGWYKVIVTAKGDMPDKSEFTSDHRPLPKQLVHAKYGQAKTTPLMIEVVASPKAGAYDLKVEP